MLYETILGGPRYLVANVLLLFLFIAGENAWDRNHGSSLGVISISSTL
jgi:hypothetical protein